MNRVILIGRFTKDPEVFHNSTNGKEIDIAKFALAVAGNYNKDKTSFINCVAFGKNASFCERYCTKGMKILVEGEWGTDNYKNKEGATVYSNNCIVNRFEFVDGKNSGEAVVKNANDGFMSIPDDIDGELPFADTDSPF